MKREFSQLLPLSNHLPALFAALILGACSIAYLMFSPERAIAQHSAIVLSAVGAVYIGFGLAQSKVGMTVVETLSGLVFGVVAIIGVMRFPLILGIGFLFHAVWDCLHHWKVVKTKVTPWYPPFCAVYDCLVGIFLLVIYLK
jgi:hypothetical protein